MKPKTTNIIGIGYIEKENRYFATFCVLNLDKDKIKRIIKYFKILNPQKDRKIHISKYNLYVTDFFEVDAFESMYPYLIESARKCVIPERIEPEILNREIDLCMLEQNVDFAVRAAADPERYRDLLKGVVDD